MEHKGKMNIPYVSMIGSVDDIVVLYKSTLYMLKELD